VAPQIICIGEYRSTKTKLSLIALQLGTIWESLSTLSLSSNISDAFKREKQIKGGSRKKKIELIESMNPEWKDMFDTLQSGSVDELIRIKKFFRSN